MKKLSWILLAATLAVQAQVPAPVTTETLTKAQQDPNSWLSYGKKLFRLALQPTDPGHPLPTCRSSPGLDSTHRRSPATTKPRRWSMAT